MAKPVISSTTPAAGWARLAHQPALTANGPNAWGMARARVAMTRIARPDPNHVAIARTWRNSSSSYQLMAPHSSHGLDLLARALHGHRHRRARRHVELDEEVRDMPFDRLAAEHEPLGDLAVRQSLGDEPRHLLLARGQTAAARVLAAASRRHAT